MSDEDDYMALLNRAKIACPETIENHERFEIPELEILQEALEKNDSSCIREALHRVVPTFHEPEEVNCGQGAEVRIPQQAAFR